MSDYSSDSDIDHHDRHRQKIKWSGHRRSLHSIFGGGKVADIVLWKNKKQSGAILAGLTIIWFLFEVEEYHFVTLLCYALLLSMLSIFLWFRMASLINWNPPATDEIQLSASTCRSFFTKVNWVLVNFYEISSGKDLRLFFLTVSSLWLVSVIGSYVSTLNLFYIVVLCVETIPTLYERHQMEVENLANKLYRELKKLCIRFDHIVLDKIPRGPVKQKKFY